MVIYDSSYIYITSAGTLLEKIRRIDVILNSLLDTALQAALGDDQKEYWLDDGQIRTKVVRNGASGVADSIKKLETIKQLYINQLNGRQVRLVDGKNFFRRCI